MISLLIAIPLLLAFISIIWRSLSKPLFFLASFTNIVILITSWFPNGVEIHAMGNWKPPFGINLVFDNASFYAALVVNAFFLLTSLLPGLVGNYGIPLMLLMAAANGFVLTGDLFNSFVFMEIITITAVTIASKKENFYNAFKYLILGGIAGSIYLLATIFAYASTGSLNMAHVSMAGISSSSLVAITTLYAIGLGVEAKLFPLNGWVSGVYGGNDLAPVILGTSVSFAALYMVGRLFGTVFHGNGAEVLYTLALITIVIGEVAALRQRNLLKTFAYSSVAQAGVVVAMLSKGTGTAMGLAYFHLTNDAVAKFVIFLVAGFLVYNYKNLNGVFKKHKVLGASFSIASFSLVGFPLFAGFQSKLRIIMEAFSMKDYLFPSVMLLATLIEVGYVVRWNVKLWFEEETQEKAETPVIASTLALILALVLITVFIKPDIFLGGAMKMGNALADTKDYIQGVLSVVKGGM